MSTDTSQASKRPTISFTSIDTHETCQQRWYFRYIENLKLPPGIALVVGTGTDRGIQANMVQKIDTHQDLPKATIVDAAAAGFEAAIKDGVLLTEEEQSIGQAKVLGQAKDTVVALAGLHADEQAKDYQPVLVQAPATIEFPACSHDMMGYIDLIDSRDIITDFKTANKSKPANDVNTSLQLTIYAAAFRQQFGQLPQAVQLDVLVKTKTPKRQLLTSTRTVADIQMMLNRMNVMLASVKAGIFTPAPVGSWACSPKFCGYWRLCPYVNHERAAAAKAGGE